jgi:hypothetical protein
MPVPGAAASSGNAGVGSWQGARSAATWTPRSVSSAAALTTSSPRPLSHFEPRVIRPEGAARSGEPTSLGRAGLSASRPQAQQRDGASAPSRARRSSTTALVGAGAGGRSGSIPRSPAMSHHHSQSQSHFSSHIRTPVSSTHTSAPITFLRPEYISYSALRDILHTDESASTATNQGQLRGSSVARTLGPPTVASRRDFSPTMTDSDDDSDAYGHRMLRSSHDRGRTRDSAAGYNSLSQSVYHNEPVLRLPSRWNEQDRNKYLSVSGEGRTLQFNGKYALHD